MLPAHSKRSFARSDSPNNNDIRTCCPKRHCSPPYTPTVLERQFVTVTAAQDGLRLDRALGELFPAHSRSALARLVEEEHVRLDGRTAKKPSQRVESGQGIEIDFPDAASGRDPRDRKRMAVVAHGRRAITEYEVAQRLRYVSLLRCTLRTGRTHQIRVHLKHIGHPIVGDPVYSGPQWRGIPEKRVQR